MAHDETHSDTPATSFESSAVDGSTDDAKQVDTSDSNPLASSQGKREPSDVAAQATQRGDGNPSAHARSSSFEQQSARFEEANDSSHKAIRPLANKSAEVRHELLAQTLKKHKRYRRYARAWGSAYYLLLYTAAAASAVAGLVLKLDFFGTFQYRTDFAAVLALGAAFLVSIAVGAVDRRRMANRGSEMNSELLELDILNPELKTEEIQRRLTEVLQRSHESIGAPD